MKGLYLALIVLAVVGLRLARYRLRRRQSSGALAGSSAPGVEARLRRRLSLGAGSSSEVALIARREITERLRGRIFRVGTLIVLLAVAAAIVIPTLVHGGGRSTQTVGVVGSLPPTARAALQADAAANGDVLQTRALASRKAATAALQAGRVNFVVVDGRELLVDKPLGTARSTADASLVEDVARTLGTLDAFARAGLTPSQVATIGAATPLPITTLAQGRSAAAQATSTIGLVLLFFMLSQYLTWTLVGVMQEKSSRVVEVLLATVRPIQLLGGKVLGIGAVALGQATLVVGFALVVASATGSDVLHGTTPLTLVAELCWLVLGYAFYSWLYAAAGSMAERQDQVQTLALPLSIPILLGYVFAIIVASSGSPDLLFKVLAYVPLTAPFAMSTLVSIGQATWWQFVAAVLLDLGATVAMAIGAAAIYRRAVLRTGARVRVGDLLARRVPT